MGSNLTRKQRSKKMLFTIGGLVYLVLAGTGILQSFAQDVSLNLSSGGGETNETVSLTLSLAYPGSPVASGFNLDIYYDDDVLENPSATGGPIVSAAGKELQTNLISHPYHGIFRLMVFGSDSVLGAGQAATIDFDIRIDAPGGLTGLELTTLDATNTQGESLAVIGNIGSIDVVVGDNDSDGILDNLDNCPFYSNFDQDDTYPPGGNGIGDACDCESDFTCDGDVDADDMTEFLNHFGRGQYDRPCDSVMPPCSGDFACDADVDAEDITLFLEDFGRGQYDRPCPPCDGSVWCVY